MRAADRLAAAGVVAWAAQRTMALVAAVDVPDADAAAEIGIAADTLDELAFAVAIAAPEATGTAVEAFLTAAGNLLRQVGREGEAESASAGLLDIVAGREVGLSTVAVPAPSAGSEPAAGCASAFVGLALGAAAVATLRRAFPARQDAQAARSTLSAAAGPVIETAGGVLGDAAGDALAGVIGAAVQSLTRIAADRSPLVRVETGVSLPSVVLAYRLYGDPERSIELVARNRVATPAAMPVVIEAVAP